ncbi:hypothetical protein HPB50_009400 [Hyalomma asiaticum]|uniref:Uncharacterized protein n=1 Tax=Hyalomma asiaticum TaxID=266040 RepID=A0ACB7SCV2_HYAAI|nr:hypothetical protein HPB50_009400 [Hyalomma asiaticum]
MTFYKDKERILSATHKLKGSEFSIREDFFPATREARRKLIEFAEAKQKFFKLSVDRMRIDDETYVKSTVVQLSR